jgi:hypothetical protein
MNKFEFRTQNIFLSKQYYVIDPDLLLEISTIIKYKIGSFNVIKNKDHFIVKLVVENSIAKNAATNNITCVIPILRNIPEMEKVKPHFYYSGDPSVVVIKNVIDKGNNLQSRYDNFANVIKDELKKVTIRDLESPLLGYYPDIVLQHIIGKLQPDNATFKLFETLQLQLIQNDTWILKPKPLSEMKLYVFIFMDRFITKRVKYDNKIYDAPYKIFQKCNPALNINYEAQELFQEVIKQGSHNQDIETFLNNNKLQDDSDSGINSGLKDSYCFPDRTHGQYKLVGAITHKGYLPDNDGHYITYYRHNDESSYFWKYDSTDVTEVTEEELISLQGGDIKEMIYLALYKCVK